MIMMVQGPCSTNGGINCIDRRLVNPVSGELHFIDSRANPIHGTAEIYAVSGQLIASQNVALGRAQLPNLADGVYGVLLRRTGEQSLFFRFVQLRP
jgi:hypothetical protein